MRAAPALLALLTAGMAAAIRAQEPQTPVFRSRIEIVAVDVSVLDKTGRPVRDLTRDDFTVRVDGTSRRILSAQFVPLGTRARPSGVAVRHYSTNENAAGGRLIVFVVDRGNIRRGEGRPLMTAASQFIGTLEPTDRVALAAIPESGPYIDFTADHRTVQRRLDTMLGAQTPTLSNHTIGMSEVLAIAHQNQQAFNSVVARECRTTAMMTPLQERDTTSTTRGAADVTNMMLRRCEMEVRADAQLAYAQARQRTAASLTALRNLLARLALMSGPKTLVLLSEGLFVDVRQPEAVQQVAAAAAAADTTIYALGLDQQRTDASMTQISPTFNDDRVLRRQGLEMLVGSARGRLFAVATGARQAFDRISREISGYYLLGFEPEGSDKDGGVHRIDVDVRRPGVEVRARRHFLAGRDTGARPTGDVLAEILRTPLLATELPMRVATFTLPGEAGKVRLVIAADIDDAVAADRLPCGFSLTDAHGKVVGAEVSGPAASAEPVDGRHEYMGSFTLDPGEYTLKLAVVDDLGHRGSVERHFTAALTPAGQLRAGALILADAPSGPGGDVRPSVDTRMRSDSVIGYVELTSEVASLLDKTKVELEIAATEDGDAVAHAGTHVESPTVWRRVAEGRLPTDLLPPGEYVARALVELGGRTVARVTRPFRLERPLGITSTGAGVRTAGRTTPHLRGPAGIAGVEGFDRQEVLSGDVVGYFLDRLPTSAAATLSGPVVGAIDAARHGRFDQVDSALAGADDENLTVVFLRGLAELSRGEINGAARTFRQTVRLSHDFFAAAFYLGACYAAAGRDQDAAAAWQTSLVTESEAPFVFSLLGDALLRQGEGAQAVDILSEARSIWPDDDGFARRLAVAYAVARRHADAMATLDPHLAAHPADGPGWMLAAWVVYDARLSGHPLGGLDEDLARMRRYRERYAEAGGSDAGLIDQWAEAVRRKK